MSNDPLKLMSFNILNSKLSSNPFEFESFQTDENVRHHINLKVLFNFSHRIFNPECKPEDKIKLKISDFLGEQITPQMNAKFCENLKNDFEVEDKDISKFEDLNNLQLSEFTKLFCKSSWDDKINKKWKKLALPVMDKEFELKKFYDFSDESEVENLFAKLNEVDKEFPQVIMDLLFRKCIKSFYDQFQFSDEVDVTTIVLRDEQIQKSADILYRKIIYSETKYDDFVFYDHEKTQFKNFYDEYNRLNTASGKVEIIFDYIIQNEVNFSVLIETDKDFINQIESKCKELKEKKEPVYQDYYPKEIKEDEKLMTICVQNTLSITDISTVPNTEVNPRSRFVQFKCGEKQFELGTVHLPAGDDAKDFKERIEELTALFNDYTVKDCTYICGDFNEKLNKESGVVKFLKGIGLTIADDMLQLFEEKATCQKMRSCLQFQINKMRKVEKSTKDAIIGKKPVELDKQDVVYQNISDHKMIVASINV